MDSENLAPEKTSTTGIRETQVQSIELAYVTAIDKDNGFFFAQMCKFTNQDLVNHNTKIHDYCNRMLVEKRNSPVDKVRPGDLLCTKFKMDDKWYRMIVQSADDDKRECSGYFVDYGNVEHISYKDLMRVQSSDLPELDQAPFGIYCQLENQNDYDQTLLYTALEGEYIMIKSVKRLEANRWIIKLPNCAYNQTFYNTYKSGGNLIQQQQ